MLAYNTTLMSTEKPVHVPRGRYPSAMYPQILTPSREYETEEQVHLLEYWRILLARKWTIIAVLLTVGVATAIYTLKQTPIYRATVSVQIDKENPNILSFKDVYQLESTDDDALRTQFEVLKSRSLARRVVEDLHLDKKDELRRDSQGALARVIKTVQDFVAPKAAPSAEPDALRPIIDAYLNRLDVAPVRQARLVNVSFESEDPALAAQIINFHASHFIKQNLQYKVEATEEASHFLEENLVTLKAKLEKAEDQLQRYSQENQILFTEDGKNTATEKLGQLQEAYTKAQDDRLHKESYSTLIETGHNDALPQVINNNLISSLTSKLADLQREDSQLAVAFQPEWPTRQRITNQIQQIRKSIDGEKARILDSVRAEYLASIQTEKSLATELEKQREVVNKMNEDIIQYNIYKADAESVRQLYDGLQKRLKEASVSAGLTASNIHVVDRAEVPTYAVRPRKALNLFLGLVAGLVSGVLIALFQDYLDSSIKSPEDITRFLSLPTLAVIPKLASLTGKKGYAAGGYGYGESDALLNDPKVGNTSAQAHDRENADLVVHELPRSLMAESYRSLRTSLLLSSSEHAPRIIVVTSAAPSEGKTTTAVNLAISLTQTGARVVLIDADMRKPRVQNIFRVGNTNGLSSFLAGASTLKEAIQESVIPGLLVIPCGQIPPNPSELILSPVFNKMVETLRQYFDFVVLDSPPVGNVSDARILATVAESTILVVKAFSTSRHEAHSAIAHLTHMHARLGGVVLNDVDVRLRSSHAGYSYYRNYYTGYGGEASRNKASGN
jgi:succinoglycan biosynthesis transport protein ExoP